jgi:hypothetical protein
VAALPPLLLAACGEETPFGVCDDEWRAAIIVEVYRASQPAADGARGFVIDGFYSDSLRLAPEGARRPGPQVELFAAWERPGTYDVYLSKEGFAPWVQRDVQVRATGCSVGSVVLRADLVEQH